MKKFTNLEKEVSFYRMNNDTNGNPRYACHFLELVRDMSPRNDLSTTELYNLAIVRAKQVGGKKFHNKQFGGGIVFQSYNLNDEVESILKLSGRAIECHRQPTTHEINRGYGATHYRTFLKSDITKKDGTLKSWFKADDGLNYSTK
mgnify:CR=1 FL=1